MTCPSFSYSDESMNGAQKYTYKNGSYDVTSGISKRTVSFAIAKEYQYTWYNNDKGIYSPFKTYVTKTQRKWSKDYKTDVHDKNVWIMMLDNSGNIKRCDTTYINNLQLTKATKGTTDIYIENGTNNTLGNYIVNKIGDISRETPEFVPASKVFLLKEATWNTLVARSDWCAAAQINRMRIYVRDVVPNWCDLNWQKATLIHELGHTVDYMRTWLTEEGITLSNYNNKKVLAYRDEYAKKIDWYGNYNYLKKYSYTGGDYEFWADLYAYSDFNLNIDNTLRNLRDTILTDYKNIYKRNKELFEEVKAKTR